MQFSIGKNNYTNSKISQGNKNGNSRVIAATAWIITEATAVACNDSNIINSRGITVAIANSSKTCV